MSFPESFAGESSGGRVMCREAEFACVGELVQSWVMSVQSLGAPDVVDADKQALVEPGETCTHRVKESAEDRRLLEARGLA